MYPPTSSPAEIDLYWSDELIFSILDEYRKGFRLPNYVLTDLSPYQHRPSNLPEGMWYLVDSNERKESVYGFWNEKEEACKIYSNSMISGWRTTLEYFEGRAPQTRKTNWLMEEYSITPNKLCGRNEPQELMSLCKVFLGNGNSYMQEIPEMACFSTGDYLELDDLEEHESHYSSSSQNSSCPSNLSDEYFDSLALLRDLEGGRGHHVFKEDLFEL